MICCSAVGHFENSCQHGGHFKKLIAWVFVNHHENVIYKKLRQRPMICFSAVGHFENSCQHGGHFEKLIERVFVNHHEDVIYKKLRQNPMICFSAVGHFENSCQYGGHFKNKVDEDAPLMSKILNTKNGVKIRCRLGVNRTQTHRHTDTQTHRHTHGTTESLHLNEPFTSLKAVWE